MLEKITIPTTKTINEAYKELKEISPENCISKFFLYELVRTNQVRHWKSGSRVYLDFNDLIRFFNVDSRQVTTPITYGA